MAEQREQQRQRVHGEIVERAVAGRGFALPVEGLGRVGHEVLIHFDADVVDGTDRALADQPPDMADHRILDIVVAHDRHPARPGGGVTHADRIGQCRRHRLFAPDMLAGFERCDRHLGVEGIGRGHRNHVDRWIGQEVAPVAGRPGKAELSRFLRRQIGIDLGERYEARTFNIAEDARHVVPRQCVALSHIARADEPDTETRHVFLPEVDQ